MTPAGTAAEAAARASAWISLSANLVDVLAWHRSLCAACQPLRSCPEYGEIISEYGAGEFGVAVFYPDDAGLPGALRVAQLLDRRADAAREQPRVTGPLGALGATAVTVSP